MRYVYGITSALLVGGTALALVTQSPVIAQVAQNERSEIAKAVPRAGAPESFADLVEQLQPAVVNISTKQEVTLGVRLDPFAGTREPVTQEQQGGGSGFLISDDGYIVTNNHVVTGGPRGEQVNQVTVTLTNGKEFQAKIVGRDVASDLALLKIDATGMPFVKFGDSGKARVGDWVVAIGNPLGLGSTVTAGIISARQRDINAGPYDDFLQTDASINRGNSGGPTFNMDGEVVGVNTAIYSPSGGSVGIGFAVPSTLVTRIVGQLRDFGRTKRGWLGVRIQAVTPEIAEGFGLPDSGGALVASVTPDGPAERAGLESGDVIVRFNDNPIDEMRELPRVVADTDVGQTVEVVIIRNGQEMTFDVELGELEAFEDQLAAEMGSDGGMTGVEKTPGDVLGMDLVPMNAEIAQQYGLDPASEGLVVVAVAPGSPADRADIAPGDIVLQVGQSPVSAPGDVSSEVDAARDRGAKSVVVLVERAGDAEFRAVSIAE